MKKSFLFWLLCASFLFCFCTCGSYRKNKTTVSQSLADNNHLRVPVFREWIPNDTIHIILNDTPKSIFIKHPEKLLIKQGVLPSYDTLLKSFLKQTQNHLITVDTARARKKRLDAQAKKIDILSERDHILNSKLDHILKNQADSKNEDSQNRTSSKASEWEIHLLFLFVVGSRLIYWLNQKKQKKIAIT